MKFNRSACLFQLLTLSALILSGASQARADYLYEGYLIPSIPTNYSAWDVFYTPYNNPNYPDIAAPYGSYQTASGAGVTPPSNSSPSNPSAYWDPRNPTITQVGTSTAFIIGPGTSGNIYSFAAPTSFQVTQTGTAPLGTALFQMQTEGSTVDFSSIKLQYTNSGGQVVFISPTQYLTEYQSDSSSFGFSVSNRLALEWNLTGLNITSFTIDYSSLGSSMSMQQASLDTASTYTSTVPQARTWATTGSGTWGTGSNWAEGTSSVENGNVFFNQTGTSTITLDASHTVGQIGFQTAGNVTINPTGSTVLTSNTGINTSATATGTYAINSKYAFGAYNLFNIAGGTVQLNGTVSGTYGFFKEGNGTLELNGNNTFTGGIGIEGGTLRLSGTNTYTGDTTVEYGKLVVAANNALGNATTTIAVGADSSTYPAGTPAGALVINGDYTVGRNIMMAPGTYEKDLGAQNTTSGATFTGAVALGSATNVHLNAAGVGDNVNFTGGITGGVAASATPSQVIIDGQGTVTLSGTGNTYLNDTVVSSGMLHVASAGSLTSNGKVTVAAGSKLVVDGTLAGTGSLDLHGTLGGSGLVNRVFTVDATSTLNPGAGAGTLTTVSETWASGGSLQFNLANATGAQGDGWNFLQINGSLNITASDVFHIDLTSLGLGNQPGLALNFDPSQNYSWKLADASGGITGFNAGIFQMNESAFDNTYGGLFTITQNSNDLFLSYTPAAVPEPSTYFLLFVGMGLLVAVRRYKRLPAAC